MSIEESEYYYLNVAMRVRQYFVTLGFYLNEIIESELNVPVLYTMQVTQNHLSEELTNSPSITAIVDCRAPVVNIYTNSPHILYVTQSELQKLPTEEEYLIQVLLKYNRMEIDPHLYRNIIEMYHNKLRYGDTRQKPWLERWRNSLAFSYNMIMFGEENPPELYPYKNQLQ